MDKKKPVDFLYFSPPFIDVFDDILKRTPEIESDVNAGWLIASRNVTTLRISVRDSRKYFSAGQ